MKITFPDISPSLRDSVLPLLPGETALPMAPSVVLDDGTNCIPQHFLSYQHTKQSISQIIADIEFDPKFVLFVDEDNASIFIQVGIIGKDNYVNHAQQEAEKIVYGRRWRVEPQLPSSEVIQTAFLALIKAREHEIRELFKHKTPAHEINGKATITTPFSCHHDLPLIAMSGATNTLAERRKLTFKEVNACLANVRFDDAQIKLMSLQTLNEQQCLMEICIFPSNYSHLPELLTPRSSFIVIDDLSEDGVLNSIMDHILSLSNRYVEENFKFKGFARFSRENSISKISALSAKTRISEKPVSGSEFATAFASANYETDSTRVPRIGNGKLGDKIKAQLNKFDIKYGILPKNEV
jgi:hypothetical protein